MNSENKPTIQTTTSDGIGADLTGAAPTATASADRVAEEISRRQGKQDAGQKETRGRKGKTRADVITELKGMAQEVDESRTDAQLKRDLSNAKRRAAASGGKSSVGGVPPSEEEEQRLQKYREMGAFVAGAFFGVTSNIDPEEWAPTPAEQKSITDGFGRVAEHYGWDDMHPVLGLTISIVSYALPRLQKPKTAEKFGPVKMWVLRKLGYVK